MIRPINPKTPNRNVAHAYGNLAEAYKHLADCVAAQSGAGRIFHRRVLEQLTKEARKMSDMMLSAAAVYEQDANAAGED